VGSLVTTARRSGLPATLCLGLEPFHVDSGTKSSALSERASLALPSLELAQARMTNPAKPDPAGT
jgi:hypothetical protein